MKPESGPEPESMPDMNGTAVATGYVEAAAEQLMRMACGNGPDPRCPHCIASNQLAKALAALDRDL